MSWSAALCRMDSDDDGLTNGDELGDGCCDQSGANGHLISHPGLRDGDCGALPCRSDKPSCGASTLSHAATEALKRSMSVHSSRDIALSTPSAVYSQRAVVHWSSLPASVCACSVAIRAGRRSPSPSSEITKPSRPCNLKLTPVIRRQLRPRACNCQCARLQRDVRLARLENSVSHPPQRARQVSHLPFSRSPSPSTRPPTAQARRNWQRRV